MAHNIKLGSQLFMLPPLFYLLTGCGGSLVEEGDVVADFDVTCNQLVCSVNASSSIGKSDILSSLSCDMGDGSPQIDLLALEVVFDYTYASPGSYDITCNAANEDGNADSYTLNVNIDGLLVEAGPNQTVPEGVTVTLDGSQSEDTSFPTTGNIINRYQWSLVDTTPPGTTFTITNSDSVNPTFVAPSNPNTTTFQILLRVSIDDGVSFSENFDTVDITVIPGGGSDLLQ